MVRAKFKVQRIVKQETWTHDRGNVVAHEVHLTPVVSGSDENKKFYEASPGGSIALSIIKGETANMFPIGAEVYVDFALAPKES